MEVAKGREQAADVDDVDTVYVYGVCGFSGPMWAPTGCCAALGQRRTEESDHRPAAASRAVREGTKQLQTCAGSLC